MRAIDQAFLNIEERRYPMHFSLSMIFEGQFSDIDGLKTHLESSIAAYPLFKKKITWVPTQNQAVWVDDPDFLIDHHVRHIQLPAPNDIRSFRDFSADLLSRPLNRNAPLWDLWIAEGMFTGEASNKSDKRAFGIIARVHHAMMDGMGALSVFDKLLLSHVFDLPKQSQKAEWTPAKLPSKTELIAEDIHKKYKNMSSILSLIASGAEHLLQHEFSASSNKQMRSRKNLDGTDTAMPKKKQSLARRVISQIERNFSETTQTSLNPKELSQKRTLEWHKLPLKSVKDLSSAHSSTINDVILAIVTLSLRGYFRQHKELQRITTFRALTPVNIRQFSDKQALGNKLGVLLIDLPLHANAIPEAISDILVQTRSNKEERRSEAQSIQKILTPVLTGGMIGRAIQTISALRPYNLVVSNVPGPPSQRYLGRSRLLSCYPAVPLYKGTSLGIAVFSYHATIYLGLASDPLTLPHSASLNGHFRRVIDELGHVK